MAVGLAITSEVGKYNGKMTPFVVLSCMIAATGGVIFGYDIGISGGVTSMEPFLKKFFPEVYTKMNEDTKISNYCKFDSQLLTSFTSSLYIAGLVASLFASSITRAFGRKPSILTGGVAFLAGSALGGAALNVYMLIFGRILLGIGIGFANQSVPLYLSEMAPPNYRGATNIGFQLCVGIGVLSANLINFGTEKIKGGWGWRISLAMAAVPASILTLGALFLPETPNSLIQNNKDHEKAKLMLQRVRDTNDVQAELDDLIKASSISKTIKHPFKNILQRKYRPQLVMAIAIPFFQQVTGINVISFYAPVLFRTIGLGESASLLSSLMITGVLGTAFTFISMLIVDKLGRRALFMIGGIQMFLSQIMVGGLMAAQLGDHGGISKGNYEGGVTSMEPFLKKFFPKVYTKMNEDTKISNYCKFDSQLLTSFTSSLYIAGFVASLFASSVTRAFGRKPSILVGAAAFLVGSALGGAAMNVSMLIFGRIFLGIGIVPLYLSEMAPPNYRGATTIGFELCVGIAMAAVPASILTLGALFLPETPNSLIQNNKDHEKAKLMLQRVQGTNDVQAELDDLIKASVQSFLTMLCHFKSGIFFFFGGWAVVMSAFVYFLLLEMKNVPIQQMNKVWSEHWFWKRFVGEVNGDRKMEAP
uniref:Major facilitator superfamily (MFS) profile domain-containing protein n=1 Tax=Fagus sylvatica TaxID=28930 RepID=A0A2N9HK10_FAGSY